MRTIRVPAALLLVAALALGCKDQISGPESERPAGPQSQLFGGFHNSYPGAPDLHRGLREHIERARRGEGGEKRAPLEKNLSLVGSLKLGISSDVWAHKDIAYVGGFGFGATVKVVDISDPRNPRLIAQLGTPFGNSPQDVKAATINTRFFRGDLLVVGNEFGGPAPFGGIQLWDVSNPSRPVLLSEPRIGPVHNTYLYQKRNRAFVLLAVSFAEVRSPLFPPFITIGDFVIVEVTDEPDRCHIPRSANPPH